MNSPHPVDRDITLSVDMSAKGERLDRWLSERRELELTRSRLQRLIVEGLVLVDGLPVAKNYRLRGGENLEIHIPVPSSEHLEPSEIPLEIVYQDDHLMVVNKPPGLVTHPAVGNRTGTLINAVVHYLGRRPEGGPIERPGVVHRLDKDTSGLLIIAKTEAAYLRLQTAIQKREVRRTYLALVCGHLKEETGRIELPIGRSSKDRKRMIVTDTRSREAITEYVRRDRFRSYDLLEVHLLTGRTHQIRVHFSHLGHPVFGDPEYGGRQKWHRGIFGPERPLARRLLGLMPRQALHAMRLEFAHPITHQAVALTCDPPHDFQEVLRVLDSDGR